VTLPQIIEEQVTEIRRIIERLSLEIASPDEARAMLETKGRESGPWLKLAA
jgi:uncharacterized protein (DUF849 family)